MDSLGRRKTILVGAVINLIGAILQCSAANLAMILVGRIMAGWAVGVLSMSVPIYQSECAHPKTRGSFAIPPQSLRLCLTPLQVL
jgi:MFS family permease